MSIRFAGSRFVHERRRRRLAQECGGVSVVPVSESDAPVTSDDPVGQPLSTTLGPSPVSSIIRPQLWVHWMITVLCLLAWGGMLYLGDLAERTDFGLRDILGLRSGRVTNFFSTVMLLWAGQLALLIYWYRRKSRNDFAGRYRMWLWIGGMLQLFLVVIATRAHRPFSLYMQRIWPVDIPLYGLLCWLVPVATLSLTMYRLLRIELKRHRSGKLLLNVSGAAAVIAGMALVVGPLLPDRVRDLAEIGSATLAHLALATALLMHARYVVHISNEVPRRRERPTRRFVAALRNVTGHLPVPRIRRPALRGLPLKAPRLKVRLLKIPSLTVPRIRLPKVSLGAVRLPRLPERKPLDPAAEKPQAAGRTPSRPTRKPEVVENQRTAGTPSSATKKSAEDASPPDRPAKKRRKPTKHRVDASQSPRGPRQAPACSRDEILNESGSEDEIDAETLQGLTKKQRRRLRKKQRELQRTGG